MPAARSVLVVDGDPEQRRRARRWLEAAGYAVLTAIGADAALAQAAASPPRAVVSDVLLGDLDGFALCARIRSHPSLAGLPVILVSTAHEHDVDRSLANAVGATALVGRSADFGAVIAALATSFGSESGTLSGEHDVLYDQHLRWNAEQRTRFEHHARDADRRYRLLFEAANDCITLLTEEGVVVDCNERWLSVIGAHPDQMRGRHLAEFLAPDSPSPGPAASDGRTCSAYRRLDGGVAYLESSESVLALDGERLVLRIGRDVTDRVLSRTRLATLEAKFEALVSRIPEVILTAGRDGTPTFVTASSAHTLGCPPSDLLDAGRFWDAVHPDDASVLRRAYAAFADDGRPFDLEHRWRKGDRWIWVRNRSIGMVCDDGRWLVEAMVSDVTERRELESRLRHAQKMEAVAQLTGGIAHDFNNIVGAILAYAELLLDALPPGTQDRADVASIKTAADRAARLTRQLLTFSRSDRTDLLNADLREIVGGLEDMIRRLVGASVRLEVRRGPEPAVARVDATRFEQVVVNLAVNARDAMPLGGTLTIDLREVGLDADAAWRLGISEGRYVRLTVTDTGCGMDTATQARIFEPFFTTKERGRGTGLGLATCHGIVHQAGGTIHVESEPGRGTCFTVLLPAVDAEARLLRPPESMAPSGYGETILVVEDDEAMRTSTARILEARGYVVRRAAAAADAVDIARLEPRIDLVLCDVVMPDLLGPAAARQLLSLRPEARVLFMSGYADHPLLSAEGVDIRPSGFVRKPFTPDALAKEVRRALDARTGVRTPALGLQNRPGQDGDREEEGR